MEKKKKLEGVILVAVFCYLANTQLVKGQPGKDCQTSCGNVTISYPFGTSGGCYYPSFRLKCDEIQKRLFYNDLEVINISYHGELRVWVNISYACYDEKGNVSLESRSKYKLESMSLSPKNRFTLVGCNAYAVLSSFGMRKQAIGCFSFCLSSRAALEANVGCTGEGCCRTEIDPRMDSYQFHSARLANFTSVYDLNPCTYAFLAENDSFYFDALRDLRNMRNVKKFPVVLDWSVGELRCHQLGNASICSGNTKCLDSTPRKGYNCKCLQGYEGNPYTQPGCKDIDECTTLSHNCSSSSTCENTLGSFRCKCPSGQRLDTTNMSCNPKDFGWPIILLGTTIAFLVILLGIICVQERMKNRKYKILRQKYFEKNGGVMLVERAGPRSESDLKIYTEQVLEEATNNYDKRNILGEGGQGTVYKGVLPDTTTIAVKKARVDQVEEFVNEILLLSKINHRNVVKLLGCCLETEIPLLVYEFASSGTLFDHLHGSLFDASLTWEHRLRIAIEIAGTLAYLHSSASVPIIHRDIKTSNILLDENLTAKLADFGSSRQIPMDEQLATEVKGTYGYLDPEYYITGLLSEKSDVFGYGVVLIELLTGQQAYCSKRPHQLKHLVSYFASAVKENRLHEVIDAQVMNEDNQREIHGAVRVALECTRVTGEDRPKMKEVAAVLEGLSDTKLKHQWADQYPEDLVGFPILSPRGETSSSTSYDSIKNITR